MKIMEFLIGPASGDFATDTWTLIGTILLCIVFGLIILLAWKFTFSRVFRLVTGSGLKVIRLCTAGGIYIPLLVWWGCHVASGEADLRQWAAFIALLIFLNYIPVNIVVHVVDHVAAYRRSAEFISRKEELERAKKKNREMKSLRKKGQ